MERCNKRSRASTPGAAHDTRHEMVRRGCFLAYNSVFLYNQKANMPVTTLEQLDLLLSLFRGRKDVYARYWEKGDRSGYSPAYEFDWAEFLAFKDKGGTLKDFPNKRLMPLTAEVAKKHLTGQQTVGIYLYSRTTPHILSRPILMETIGSKTPGLL